MKKTIFTTIILAFIGLSTATAQVGIGTTTPNASAILEVQSTSKGFLPPRMTTVQRDLITSPAEGLTIFNIDNNCIEFWNATYWISVCDGSVVTTIEVSAFTCGSATFSPSFYIKDVAYTGTLTIPYTGGNGANYPEYVVTSTGNIDFTATLPAGTLVNGAGNLVFNVTGTSSSVTPAVFTINFGGQSCSTLKLFTCQNDISVGTGAIVQMMYPYSGAYNTFNYSWCAREVTQAGYTWLDRNLGAYRVATSSTDAQSYGDLIQWGRKNDGHAKRVQRSGQLAEESNDTQGVMVNGTTTTNADVPGNALFITEPDFPFNWRVNPNSDLWSGVGAVNNPCPTGYRVPNSTELQDLDNSFIPNTSGGAYGSNVKMPIAGSRISSSGILSGVGLLGRYWSSTVSGSGASRLGFSSGGSNVDANYLANGFSVRCIKD